MVSLREHPPSASHLSPASLQGSTASTASHQGQAHEISTRPCTRSSRSQGLSCDPWDLSNKSPLWVISSRHKVEQAASGWLTDSWEAFNEHLSSLAALAERDLSWEQELQYWAELPWIICWASKKVQLLFRKVHKPTVHPAYRRHTKKKSLYEPIF